MPPAEASWAVDEEEPHPFVKRVLDEHLRPLGVAPDPVLIGGSVTVRRLAFDMALLYYSHDSVTSLVDFYEFPRKGDRSVEALETHVREKIGERVGAGWDENRVFPYVQMHEFEGLLFSNVEVFATQIDFPQDCVAALRAAREQFTTPEDINDNYETAPSRRIASAIPRYKKRLHGPILAKEIGLDTIRAECPRFNAWVRRLESLGTE